MQTRNAIPSRPYKDATSKTDLCNILSNCTICYQSTGNGDFIVSHTELPRILLNRKTLGKKEFVNFIVNTKSIPHESTNTHSSPHEYPQELIGHWFLLTTTLIKNHCSHPKAIICDPLNKITKDSEIMANIDTFCKNNLLRKYEFSAKYQSDTNFCGYLVCGIMAYIHENKRLNKLLPLRRLFLRNSVKSNEKTMLKSYENHFL